MAILKNQAMDAAFSEMLNRVGISVTKYATLPAEQKSILFSQFVREQFADQAARAALITAIQGVL